MHIVILGYLKRKKDICRFSIIEDFKQNIDIIYDNTDYRIGFKSYLEGPKKLQKIKKIQTNIQI